ncbi:hypothetical protein BJX62DRAFT_236359 [Aspergillus germanicus]
MAFENEPAISLEFPELRSINDHFEVRGNITSASRLNFSVPLEKVDSIHLSGNVETASFPALTFVKTVEVNADYAFDCEGLLERIQRVWSRMDVASKWFRFECHVPPPRAWTGVGSSMAVLLVGFIVLFVLIKKGMRWMRRRLLQMDMGMSMGMDELPAYVYPANDPPPKYSPYDGKEWRPSR